MKSELICEHCGKKFLRENKDINQTIKKGRKTFCSYKCFCLHETIRQKLICPICGKEFERVPFEIKKSKSGLSFCSRSCGGKYNSVHKMTGTRVSKLEVWLQQKLPEIYPDLEFHFNRKDAIVSELDIYIPSLKLAFELNGIFHYEPIHGSEKLTQIQNNDQRKFAACLENGISLCIIDSSSLKYFKEQNVIKYLNIITNIINNSINSNT
jgi:hypothetical protein